MYNRKVKFFHARMKIEEDFLTKIAERKEGEGLK